MTTSNARRRASMTGALIAVSGAVLIVACTTDYQQGKDDPKFGLPNALAGGTQPGPSSDDGTAASSSSSTGGSSAIACVKAGGTVLDAGACAVSFKTDVLGAYKTGGCDQTGCHGGLNPGSPPRIDTADGPGMWSEFAAFKMSTGQLYVNPCSADTAQSGIGVNVDSTADPNKRGALMPLGSTTGLPAAVVTKLQTWVKCGAPNN